MDCKNCKYTMDDASQFCQHCGAKMIVGRLSIKKLIREFFTKVFGWENNYFKTFRTMLISPDMVISDYIKGVRKRHMSPITFLLIGLTIATLVFNMFSEKYIELNTTTFLNEDFYRSQFDATKKVTTSTNPDEIKKYEEAFKVYKDEQMEFLTKWNKYLLKYFNLAAFILMPFYTLISMLVFGWKKYNYSEHLVINSYIQGLTMIGTTLLFIMALIVHPNIYLFTVIVAFFYYSLTYKKLYNLSFGKLLLKIGKFLIILLLTFLLSTIIGGIIVVIIGFGDKLLGT